MTSTPADHLSRWLSAQVSPDSWQWLSNQIAGLETDYSDKLLHVTLGLIPRKLGKQDLQLGKNDIANAQHALDGWRPQTWSVDTAARVWVLCSIRLDDHEFTKTFTELCRYADVAEQIALYKGLPLYPNPDLLETQAAEGLRSNIHAVFEAVAHDNPFPKQRFDIDRWNQMVLKALFVDSQLWPIQGLDERANPELAKILCDYAHERWSAGRTVSVELWRCVGPYAQDELLSDLKRVLSSEVELERQAGAVALAASPDANARALLEQHPKLASDVCSGQVNWNSISARLDNS